MTTYYIDFDNGDNSNNGLTKDTAWKHAPKMNGATGNPNVYTPLAGDEFLFARGSLWPMEGWWLITDISGSAGNPIVFNAYDRDGESRQENPVFEMFRDLTALSWADQGSDIWRATISTGLSEPTATLAGNIRVFVDRIGKGRAESSVAIDGTDENFWFYDGTLGYIYVYAPSDPSVFYAQLESVDNDSKGFTAMTLRDAAHWRLSNLEFHGSVSCIDIHVHGTTPVETGDIILDNITTKYNGKSVFIRNLDNTGATLVDGVTVKNCNFDKKWQIAENDGGGREEVGDAVSLADGNLHNITVKNNVITNYGHATINISKADATHTQGINNILIEENTITSPNNAYVRGIAVSSTDNLTGTEVTNCVIRGNYIGQTNVQNQIAGYGTKFYGNVVDTINQNGATASGNKADQVHAVRLESSNVGGSENVASGVEVANNLILNSLGYGIYLTVTTNYTLDTNYVKNNIVLNCGFRVDYNDIQVALEDLSGASTINTQECENNNFYSTETLTTVDWKGTTYTVTAANAGIAEFSANNAINEDLDNYSLKKSSSLLGTGVKWFSGPNPQGFDGEPFSSFDIDPGANQSTFGPFHTKNL